MTAPTEAFVGRDRELEILRAALDAACAGSGRLVMLAGEPGIGKTRLARELAGQAAARGGVLWGRCHEEAGAPPYWPWVHVLRAIAARPEPRSAHRSGRRRARHRRSRAGDLRQRLPGLERSAPLGDPAEARFRMFGSIRRFLATLCRRRPLVLMLDDVHWADAPSLRLLEFLAPELGDSNLLVIGTYRDDRAVATAPPVRHAGRPGPGAAFRAPPPRRVKRRGGASVHRRSRRATSRRPG